MSPPKYHSRRATVIGENGAVACGQQEAASIGIEILKAGGNAADAAVAVAAAMSVLQPCSTGLGGDAFCLYYEAKTKRVHGLNGSGRCPSALNLDVVNKSGYSASKHFPNNHGFAVTVPGAAAAWVDTIEHFGSGKLSLQKILHPAIMLAQNGFHVSEITSYFWDKGLPYLLDSRNKYGANMCINGRAPKWGEKFQNPDLAGVLKNLAKNGKKDFYEGSAAEAIVEAVAAFGGVMTKDDLANHTSTIVDPISVDYKGVRLWEIPPNGQGIVALIALNILKTFDLKEMGHNSADYLHTVIEALRLAFADGLTFIGDLDKVKVPVPFLLCDMHATERRSQINLKKAMETVPPIELDEGGTDTVYFTVVDRDGNACSFINSNYSGFGTGIVPRGCGFTLQNRGCNFSLSPESPNQLEPGKRPYHTIIPAMVTDTSTGDLLSSYGVMGGFMQPQGHVQVLLNMLEFGMSPQAALDAPRFCIGPGHAGPIGSVSIEEGISDKIIHLLRLKGHQVQGPVSGHDRALFGRGHVITKGTWWYKGLEENVESNTDYLWAGSDPRADGMALTF